MCLRGTYSEKNIKIVCMLCVCGGVRTCSFSNEMLAWMEKKLFDDVEYIKLKMNIEGSR